MSIEPIYEGMISGSKIVDSNELQDPGCAMEAGRVCCLSVNGNADANTVYFGGSVLGDFVAGTDAPFGIMADYKEDVVASGKASVYFAEGLYRTDQISGAIARGDTLTFDEFGLVMTATLAGQYLIGICTEAAGNDGSIELHLCINGSKYHI